jgi:hypothetical protein
VCQHDTGLPSQGRPAVARAGTWPHRPSSGLLSSCACHKAGWCVVAVKAAGAVPFSSW